MGFMENITKKMMGASDKDNQESWGIIKSAAAKKGMQREGYELAYGYYLQHGAFIKKFSHYAISFCPAKKEILLVAMDVDGDACGTVIVLNASTIQKAKKDMQGNWVITDSGLSQALSISVPPFIGSANAGTGVLPISQEKAATEFEALMKGF